MRRFRVRFAACLAFASVVALGWMTEGLAEESAPPPAKNTARPAAKAPPSSANAPEEAAARFSKQLAALQEQWTALSAEESPTLIRSLAAVKTAMDNGKIEDVKKTRDDLGKGKIKGEWREYKQVLMAAGQQWEVLAQKLSRAANQVKPLEKDRDKGSADAQAMFDTLSKRIADKHRAVVERSADCYYDAGESKKALAIYAALYQEIPEDKRAAEKLLTAKLADVLDKTGDFKTALRLYDGLYKAASAQERKTWTTFDIRNRLAGIYFDKLNDYKTALEFYKGMLETYEPDRRETNDTKWIRDKITACEDKAKTTPGTAPAGKATPAKRAGS